MTKTLLNIYIIFFSFTVCVAQKNIKVETNENIEIESLRQEIKLLELRVTNKNLQEKIIENKIEFEKKIENTKENFNDKLNTYVFFIGLILALIGAAINFFGKKVIRRRVEEIIKITATKYAKDKTDEIIANTLTQEYTSNIIRQKGEPEITKLLAELETKGKQTISAIKLKGDEVINSVWAKSTNEESSLNDDSDNRIKRNIKQKSIVEFFNLAYNTNDPKVQYELYKNVIEIDPKNTGALNNMGVSMNNMNNYEQAIEHFNQVIEIDQNYFLAYSNRAFAYSQLDNFEQGLKDANKAIEINKNHESAYATIGNIYTKQKKFVEAEEILNKSLSINPKSAIAYFNRGFFYEKSGLYEKSLKDYLKAEELKFDNEALLYNNIAVAHRRLKQYEKAIENLEKARSVNPDYPNLDGTMALIYADQGNDQKFYSHLKTALDKGCKAWNYLEDKGFDKYRNDNKLIKLLETYKRRYDA